MKLAKVWRTDIEKVPRGSSVLLAATYADHPTAWMCGEATQERDSDGGQWYWANGTLVEPGYVPKAWVPIPFVILEDE